MPNLERTLVRQFEMPNETDRAALDRMCSSYGFVASKFLFAFQTRELRSEVKDFRAFRNRLVTALRLASQWENSRGNSLDFAQRTQRDFGASSSGASLEAGLGRDLQDGADALEKRHCRS